MAAKRLAVDSVLLRQILFSILLVCASSHVSAQAMRGAFESAADHLGRCGGDASVHTAHYWFVAALAETISDIRDALGVDVEVFTDPTMLVQLPNGSDNLYADVGVLNYHGIRRSKLALDALVSGLFGVSSPPSPEAAHISSTEKTKLDKYQAMGVRSRPDIRLIPFDFKEFGALRGHATVILTELIKQAAAC
jgi:hypothetical protein